MAAAIPVVASRVGVNPSVIREGETGYCVDDAAGWTAALERLADDPGLRERLGRCGRDRVEREYSLRVLGARIAGVLREAARA
jgi:glycosyltransferase involved in cell wall biosynthesis